VAKAIKMSKRISKVNQVIKEELARLIQKKFAPKFITVTDVETSLDLSYAKIWISVYNENTKKVLQELAHAAPNFQTYLGKKLFIKNIPKLTFRLDKSAERVEKIDKLLYRVKK